MTITDFCIDLLSPVDDQSSFSPLPEEPQQTRYVRTEDGLPHPVEFFLASDSNAIIEHTRRAVFLQDNDIAHISNGGKLYIIFEF